MSLLPLLLVMAALFGVPGLDGIAAPEPVPHCRVLTMQEGTTRDDTLAALDIMMARAEAAGVWSRGDLLTDHQIQFASSDLPDAAAFFAPGRLALAEVIARGPIDAATVLPDGVLRGPEGPFWYRLAPPVPLNAHIRSAMPDFDANGAPAIMLELTDEGAQILADLTAALSARVPQGALAIVMDDQVLTAPIVREQISGGKGMVAGSFSIAQTTALAAVMSRPPLDIPFYSVSDPVDCVDRTPNQED